MSVIEITSKAREYRELQAEIKELEAQADALKQIMIREMDARQIEKLDAGEYQIRYQLVESNRLDTARLKTEQPSIYQLYTKSTVTTRFQVA